MMLQKKKKREERRKDKSSNTKRCLQTKLNVTNQMQCPHCQFKLMLKKRRIDCKQN